MRSSLLSDSRFISYALQVREVLQRTHGLDMETAQSIAEDNLRRIHELWDEDTDPDVAAGIIWNEEQACQDGDEDMRFIW